MAYATAEKAAAAAKRFRKNNPESVRASQRRWNAKNKDRVAAYKRRYSQANAAKQRAIDMRRRFGISIEDYDELLIAQVGRCAICGAPPTKRKALAVDHDHETGNLRGLLCSNCNVGLGNFKDDPARLATAINYLEEVK